MGNAAQQGQARAAEWIDGGKGIDRTPTQVEAARETASRNFYRDIAAYQQRGKSGDYNQECHAITQQLVDKGVLPKVEIEGQQKTKAFQVVGATTDKKGMVVAIGHKSDGHAEQVAVLGADGRLHEAIAIRHGGKASYSAGRVLSERDIAELKHGRTPKAENKAPKVDENKERRTTASTGEKSENSTGADRKRSETKKVAWDECRLDGQGPVYVKMNVDGKPVVIERKPATTEYAMRDSTGEHQIWAVKANDGSIGYVDKTENGLPRHNVVTAEGVHQSWCTETRSGEPTDTILTVRNGDKTMVLVSDPYVDVNSRYTDLRTNKQYVVLENEKQLQVVDPTTHDTLTIDKVR